VASRGSAWAPGLREEVGRERGVRRFPEEGEEQLERMKPRGRVGLAERERGESGVVGWFGLLPGLGPGCGPVGLLSLLFLFFCFFSYFLIFCFRF
jgi:hypothetical protein